MGSAGRPSKRKRAKGTTGEPELPRQPEFPG